MASTRRLKLDEFNNADFEGLTAENFRGIDVAIDFSIPAAVPRNVEGIAALGVNIVVGTTGWLEHEAAVRQAVERNGIGLVWSPNFSIGVNVFFRLVTEAARLLADAAGVRRVGLGDPPCDQEGCAFRYTAEAGG